MLCICLCRRFGWAPEKCRQSARLFLQSSELRLPHPHPLTRRRVCSPPPLVQGGYTLTAGEGVGGPNSDEGTDTMVLLSTYLYMHFEFTGMGEGHYTQTICIYVCVRSS